MYSLNVFCFNFLLFIHERIALLNSINNYKMSKINKLRMKKQELSYIILIKEGILA